jgi:hypothetical protein
MRISENGFECVIRVKPVNPSGAGNSPQPVQSSHNILMRPMAHFACPAWYSEIREIRHKLRQAPRFARRGRRGVRPYVISGDTLQKIHERVADLGAVIVGDPGDVAFHVFHQSIQIIAGIGDADHSDSGPVPQAAGFDFRGRNVEMRPQPVFDAAHYLPFVFERLRRFNAQLDGEKGNHADSFWFQVSGVHKSCKRIGTPET